MIEQQPRNMNEQDIRQQQQKQQQQYDTFLYKFQQQIIDAWKPVPYTKNNVILYSVLTIICVTLGLVLILTAPNTQEIEQRYDQNCNSTTCTLTFTLTADLAAPSYFYYGLTNYYQNHRRYLKFFSVDQMGGIIISETDAIASCGDELYTNKQIGAQVAVDDSKTALDPSAVAFPCGARAKSYLLLKPQIDSFELEKPGGGTVILNKTGIAWPEDPNIYVNSNNLSIQAIDNADESWLVWYRPAARNNFFKLHSRIEEDLPAGDYTFTSNNNFQVLGGQKWIFLGKSNYVGNHDLLLGIAFLSLGGGCLIVLVIFIAKYVTEIREKPKQE